jgi:hypothetical protein
VLGTVLFRCVGLLFFLKIFVSLSSNFKGNL